VKDFNVHVLLSVSNGKENVQGAIISGLTTMISKLSWRRARQEIDHTFDYLISARTFEVLTVL